MTDAIVVGAGPNGLAAAVTLARHGVAVTVLEAEDEIGGGARSGELTVPGLLHDHCSNTHPLGVGSPLLSSLDLAAHGLQWCWPEIDLVHPLDSGEPGVMVRAIGDTCAGLGVDGHRWRKLFGPLTADFDDLAEDVLRPVAHLPKHPVKLARFGMRAALPATALARRWQTDQARALFAGAAAHQFHPLTSPISAAIGLMLIASGHRFGWPVARGGSRSITDALAALLTNLGGKVETGARVRSLSELGKSEVVMLDVAPRIAADIIGDRMPRRVRRAYRRFRYGPAAFRVSLAVEGGIPWRDEACRRAGFLHLGGTIDEVAAAERDVNRGKMPQRPFVLLAQQYLADPSRSVGDVHPVDAYTHVPHDYPGDATDAVIAQIERFAPGVRERIVATYSRSPRELAADNANLIGGDIGGGANTPLQLTQRPRIAVNPYATGVPGVYLCSASTPPGAGVHGMCGYQAAMSALRRLG